MGAPDRLAEVPGVRPDEPGLVKRWFHGRAHDLFVWQRDAAVVAFRFCYPSGRGQNCAAWGSTDSGFHRVDEGDGILPKAFLEDLGLPPPSVLARVFDEVADGLPDDVRTFVREKLAARLSR